MTTNRRQERKDRKSRAINAQQAKEKGGTPAPTPDKPGEGEALPEAAQTPEAPMAKVPKGKVLPK